MPWHVPAHMSVQKSVRMSAHISVHTSVSACAGGRHHFTRVGDNRRRYRDASGHKRKPPPMTYASWPRPYASWPMHYASWPMPYAQRCCDAFSHQRKPRQLSEVRHVARAAKCRFFFGACRWQGPRGWERMLGVFIGVLSIV